jgi:methyl-accepting chemotaxis protein
MNGLRDMSIRSKLSLVFGLAFALTIAVGAFELSQLRAVNRVAVDIRENWMPRVELLGELKRSVNQHRSLALRQLQTTNFRYLLEIATTSRATAEAIETASAEYARVVHLPAEQRLLERFVGAWAEYRQINAEVLAHLEVGALTTAFSEFDASKVAFQAATAHLERCAGSPAAT